MVKLNIKKYNNNMRTYYKKLRIEPNKYKQGERILIKTKDTTKISPKKHDLRFTYGTINKRKADGTYELKTKKVRRKVSHVTKLGKINKYKDKKKGKKKNQWRVKSWDHTSIANIIIQIQQ
jgi:hypothetical protein